MIEEQLQALKDQLQQTTEFIERMEIEGKIEDLEIRLGQKLPPRPVDSSFECFGCGS